MIYVHDRTLCYQQQTLLHPRPKHVTSKKCVLTSINTNPPLQSHHPKWPYPVQKERAKPKKKGLLEQGHRLKKGNTTHVIEICQHQKK